MIEKVHVLMENMFNNEFEEEDTIAGLSDDELTYRFRESVRIDNEIKRIKGVPIAGYDVQTRCAYLEYPDGSRKYIKKA